MDCGLMETVKATELSRKKMDNGNERIYQTVIDEGIRKEWVGIGWIKIGKASKEDYKKYPVVVRGNKI